MSDMNTVDLTNIVKLVAGKFRGEVQTIRDETAVHCANSHSADLARHRAELKYLDQLLASDLKFG